MEVLTRFFWFITVTFSILAFLVPVFMVRLYPKCFYRVQKAILNRWMPKSPKDESRLLINGVYFLFSAWCMMMVFITFIEILVVNFR